MNPCEAKVRHAHGRSVCVREEGHDGDHGGWCESCEEVQPDSGWLEWSEDGEDWGR